MKGPKGMERGNYSLVTEFLLLGFTDYPELRNVLFLAFLMIYVVTMVGNLGIILLIWVDSQLHTPMYFFLSQLSFVDLCYATIITPKLLSTILSERKVIAFSACITQMYLFIMFVVVESFLLAVMAYDRYVAICNPLLYTVVMSRKLCVLLMLGCYLWGILCALVHTCSLLRVFFCGPNSVNHIYCDLLQLLNLSCSDTHINHMLFFIFASFVEISTLIIIIMSYIFIIISILKIHSNKGKYKAFSTCASHFTCITVFHASILMVCWEPSDSHSQNSDRVAAVFYTIVTPMLNPMIYSLRNRDMKGALKRLVDRKVFSRSRC